MSVLAIVHRIFGTYLKKDFVAIVRLKNKVDIVSPLMTQREIGSGRVSDNVFSLVSRRKQYRPIRSIIVVVTCVNAL